MTVILSSFITIRMHARIAKAYESDVWHIDMMFIGQWTLIDFLSISFLIEILSINYLIDFLSNTDVITSIVDKVRSDA